jgi:hypothetical protein
LPRVFRVALNQLGGQSIGTKNRFFGVISLSTANRYTRQIRNKGF